MAEAELSERMQRLADALRAAQPRPRAAFCGFDLWLEVMGSGHVRQRELTTGGRPVGKDEDDIKLRVPMPVLGSSTIVGFDPTLPPDEFELKA